MLSERVFESLILKKVVYLKMGGRVTKTVRHCQCAFVGGRSFKKKT